MPEKYSAIPADNTIVGVEFKVLKTWPDERGFFRELIRHTDPFFNVDGSAQPFAQPFAQWSHSKMEHNTVKAWHFHHLQIDWWYCGVGVIHTVLFDLREESPTYRKKIELKMGDPDDDPQAISAVVKIPQGVGHGLRVLTDFAHLFYVTSETYNPNDEGRHPFDSDVVPHSWGDSNKFIVAANDRRTFIPTAARKPLNSK